jgi:hypothetical protein
MRVEKIKELIKGQENFKKEEVLELIEGLEKMIEKEMKETVKGKISDFMEELVNGRFNDCIDFDSIEEEVELSLYNREIELDFRNVDIRWNDWRIENELKDYFEGEDF